MDPFFIGILGVAGLFLLIVLGTNIAVALAITGFLGIWFIVGFDQAITMSVSGMYHKVASPALITLPLFILMGYAASGGGISRDIFQSLGLWLGKFRSGLGIATVGACSAFGAVCGSSVVTTTVFAKTAAPEMRRAGYSKSLAYAICASSGTIGMLIPPSVLAIVYAMLSGVSTGKVLMGGVAPGLLFGVAFAVVIVLVGKKHIADVERDAVAPTWGERLSSLKGWWPIAVVAGAIFGGIYGGYFSPSEAAAVAAFVLIVMYVVRRLLFARSKSERSSALREANSMLTDTATTSAMIFFIMAGATVFSNFLVLSGVATRLSDLVTGWQLPGLALVALFGFAYLILGCLLDSISILSITIPVFNPIVSAAGIDPIWYAVLVITVVEIGLITPPVGLNLFAAKAVAESDVQLEDIVKGIVPFFIAELVILAVLFALPWIATFLPGMVG